MPPTPPYYAVIFVSRSSEDDAGYGRGAARMVELAAQQPGFLGIDTVSEERGGRRIGLTVSYWQDEQAILAWKQNAEHAAARAEGRERWYDRFDLHVAKVERSYGWQRAERDG